MPEETYRNPADPSSSSAGGGRVLIVDHDPNDLGVLASLLRGEGYEVDLAASARGAAQRVAAAEPELILLEVELPDGDGVRLYERLKTELGLADTPVIFLGASSDAERRVEALELGGADFVSRPFANDELLARVKRQVTVARIRAALQESEAKFRSVTESAIDAIISAGADGCILSWNPAAARTFGWNEEEMLGEPLERIIPERFRSAHRQGLNRVASGGPSRVIGSTVEVAAVTADGSEIPVELSLASWSLNGERYFTGIIRDISERKAAEARYRSVTEAAIDAIVSADQRGRIVGWNKAAAEIFGWSEEEAAGQELELIIPERYRAAHRAGIDRMTSTGEGRVIGKTVELAGLRRDGSEIPIELSLSSWTVDGERFYTGIIRDISERKAAEAELRRSAAELARQHDELRSQHEELQRSKEALSASFRQAQRLFSAVTDGLPGAVLNGKYRLDEKIAAGGFGVVYRATQLALHRQVAIKVLRPPSQEDEESMLRRFRREGVSTCRVNHLNAVAVIDLDVSEGGFPYIVMEYLEGQTVADRLRREGALPADRAVAIAADVFGVLAAIHRAGVIHRDIKPSNVFLQRVGQRSDRSEIVKVLDFGLARLMEEPEFAGITRTGILAGTPAYMAPERLGLGGKEGPASDVYSGGVLLYECLGGRHPWADASDVVQTIQAKTRKPPKPLASVVDGLPAELLELVGRSLERRVDLRPSAGEMEVALRRLLDTGATWVSRLRSRDEAEDLGEAWLARRLTSLPFDSLLGDEPLGEEN